MEARDEDRPMVVDLDGTLIRTDSLHELLLRVYVSGPPRLLAAMVALGGGKAVFKDRVAAMASLSPEALPYNDDVLEFLRAEKAKGRRLVLATASHESVAREISEHLGLFDAVIASTREHNLRGKQKLTAIEKLINGASFDYIGNALVDRPMWAAAGRAYVVASSDAGARQLAGVPVERRFSAPRPGLKTVLRAMRIHQWAKNMLIFAPLFLAQRWSEPRLWLLGTLAFVSFGMCASATYLWNDLLDLPADRLHRSKRFRPLASGALSIGQGLFLSLVLILGSFAIAFFPVGPAFAGLLLLYVVTTVSYSVILKRKPIADVVTLACLYGLRILAGGVAMSVVLTDWLMVFSIFFFLSLGFMKRLADLPMSSTTTFDRVPGRGYGALDRPVVVTLGIAAGYCSIIILALYIRDPNVVELYPRPQFLWVVCMTLLYWLSRCWILSARGHIDDDPVVFALKDKISLGCGVVTLVFVLLAGLTIGDFG
ncbi:MAG: UbiA family prenyltransferase [Myxococcota bacterium]